MRAYLAVLAAGGISAEHALRAAQLARRQELPVIVKLPNVLVAGSVPETHLLHRDAGLVLGEVYYRHGPTDAFDGSEREIGTLTAICETDTLAQRCWGSFLAIHVLRDGAISVYHSPFSSMLAYYAQIGDAIVVSSDARMVSGFLGVDASIDWDRLAGQLAFDNLSLRSTCVEGVRELRCGDTLRIAQGEACNPTANWDPWKFAHPSASFESEVEALTLLERELLRCTVSRVQRLDNPILDLSGGLDSSLLAAMCKRASAEVRAVNLFSERSEGDERAFARDAARHLGLALSEHSPDAGRVDVAHCATPHLARPHARSFVQEIDRLTLAAAPGAVAFVNGGGGDAVFCHLQSSAPAVDALKAMNRGPSFLKTVNEVAQASQCSFWLALRKSLSKAVRRGCGVRLAEHSTFMPRSMVRAPAFDELPWAPPPHGILPGKCEHVLSLYNSCFNMHGFERSGLIKPVYPLLSQPLVEVCLRIPSWMWLHHGSNRYLARQLAAKWLPEHVAWRPSKGGLGQLQRDLFRANRTLMREMLLDGSLQRHGLIDRVQVAAHLGKDAVLRSDQFARLLRLCDFEAWAQSWTARDHLSLGQVHGDLDLQSSNVSMLRR